MAPTVPPPRRRFRPALLPGLAALAAIAACVAMGNWQRGRMLEKEALRAQHDAYAAAAPAALPRDPVDAAQWRYRRVRFEGEYVADRQVLLDNRVHAGRAGYHAVAPVRLSDGRYVLVDRGFAPAGRTRADLPAVPPPAGPVTLSGRVNLVPSGSDAARALAESGPVRQRIDVERFAAELGGSVLPVLVEQDAQGAPADGLVRAWPAPDFGIDKHRIYMGQWYAFAALAAFLWLWFGFRRGRGERRA